MAARSKLRAWARDLGLTDRAVARLMGKSKWTVASWHNPQRDVCEPTDWRELIIAGFELEIARLREAEQRSHDIQPK